jgi:large subunit ribosomal protein L22
MEQITRAKLNYLNIAPRKVRLVAGVLRGLPVSEAEARLMLMPQRSARPLLKLLRSAIASAKNNQKLEAASLFVSEIRVDQGPILKRSLPRAMGRATPIHKKLSHVSLSLTSGASRASRFVIQPPVKKEKKPEKHTSVEKAKKGGAGEHMPKDKKYGRDGFFKRIFQRKSV